MKKKYELCLPGLCQPGICKDYAPCKTPGRSRKSLQIKRIPKSRPAKSLKAAAKKASKRKEGILLPGLAEAAAPADPADGTPSA